MSIKWKRRLDIALFFMGMIPPIAALHFLTQFDVLRSDMWVYLWRNLFLHHVAPMPFSAYLAAAPVTGLLLALLGRVTWRFTSYGDARYANGKEIRDFGLRAKRGVVLGAYGGKKLRFSIPRHLLVSAGTQSGKTQGLVIPTLLEYPGAAVVIDAKGELWDATAAARSKFSDCYRLEWTANDTAQYNPISLLVMPTEADEVERRVNQIASIMAPSPDRGSKDYFQLDAFSLLSAIMVLEVFDARHDKRDAEITRVAHWCSDFSPEDMSFAKQLKTSPLNVKLSEAHERALQRGYPKQATNDLNALSVTPDKQLIGVSRTLDASIASFKSGAVREALSGCSFSARSLVQGDRPGTVYIVVQSQDRESVSAMTTTLITNIIYTLISRTKAEADSEHSMLMLLEEFTSLKKTAAIPEAYDRGAGMGVHVMTIVQAFSQIQEIYGREALDTFLQNTDYLAAFAQGDAKSREMLAGMVGKETRMRYSRSDGGKGDTYSENLEGVPLILPQDWGAIPFGEHRILVKRHHNRPIKAKTTFAYKDRDYKKLLGATPLPHVQPAGKGLAKP